MNDFKLYDNILKKIEKDTIILKRQYKKYKLKNKILVLYLLYSNMYPDSVYFYDGDTLHIKIYSESNITISGILYNNPVFDFIYQNNENKTEIIANFYCNNIQIVDLYKFSFNYLIFRNSSYIDSFFDCNMYKIDRILIYINLERNIIRGNIMSCKKKNKYLSFELYAYYRQRQEEISKNSSITKKLCFLIKKISHGYTIHNVTLNNENNNLEIEVKHNSFYKKDTLFNILRITDM